MRWTSGWLDPERVKGYEPDEWRKMDDLESMLGSLDFVL